MLISAYQTLPFSTVELVHNSCSAAITLRNGSYLSIDHVTVSKSLGYGLEVQFLQNPSFISNSVFSVNSGWASHFDNVLNVTFINCSFESNYDTAIFAELSNLVFRGQHTFRNNTSHSRGGGLWLYDSYPMHTSHLLTTMPMMQEAPYS